MVEKNPSDFDPEEYLTDILPPGLMTPDLPEELGGPPLLVEEEISEDPGAYQTYEPTPGPWAEEEFMGMQAPATLDTSDGPIVGTKENFTVYPAGGLEPYTMRDQKPEDLTRFEAVLDSGSIEAMVQARSDPMLMSLSGPQLRSLDMAIAKEAVERGYGGNPPLDISLQSVLEGSGEALDYLDELPMEAASTLVGIEGMPGTGQEGDWRGGQLVGINNFKTWLVKEKGLTFDTAGRIANSTYEYIVNREADQPLALTVSEEGFAQRNIQTAYNMLMAIPSIIGSMGYVAGKDVENFLERVPAREGGKVQDRWYRVEEHMAYSVPDVRAMATTLQLMQLDEKFEEGTKNKVANGLGALLLMAHELQIGPMELYEQIVGAKPSGDLTEDNLLHSFLSRDISAGYKEALESVLAEDKEHPFMDLPGFLWSDETLSEKAPSEFARKIKSWLTRAQGYHAMGTERAKSPKLQKRIDRELDRERAGSVADSASAMSAPRLPEGVSAEDVPYNWDLVERLYNLGYDEEGYEFFVQDPEWAGVRTAPAERLEDVSLDQPPVGMEAPGGLLIESLREAGFSDIHDIRDITEEEARKRFRLLKLLEEESPYEEGEIPAQIGDDPEAYIRTARKKRKTPTQKYTSPIVEGLAAGRPFEEELAPEERDEYFIRTLSLLGAGSPWDKKELRSLGDKILKNTLSRDAAEKFAEEVVNRGSPEVKNFLFNYFGHQMGAVYSQHLEARGVDPASFDPKDAMDLLEYALKDALDFGGLRPQVLIDPWGVKRGEDVSWYEVPSKPGFVGPDPEEYEGPGSSLEYYAPGGGDIYEAGKRQRRSGLLSMMAPIAKGAVTAGALMSGGSRAFDEDNFLRALNTAIANAQSSREETIMYNLLQKGMMGEHFRNNPQEFGKLLSHFSMERFAESTGSSYLQNYIRAIDGGLKEMPHHIAVSTYYLGAAGYERLTAPSGEEPSYTEDELEAIDRVKTLPILNLIDISMMGHITGKAMKGTIRNYRAATNKYREWRDSAAAKIFEDAPPGEGGAAVNSAMEAEGIKKVVDIDPPVRDLPPVQVWEPLVVAEESAARRHPAVSTPVAGDYRLPGEGPLFDAAVDGMVESGQLRVDHKVRVIQTAVGEGYEIVTADGMEVAPKHLEKVVSENTGRPGVMPSVETLGIEPRWGAGAEAIPTEGMPRTTGTPPLSQPQNLDVSRISGPANARNLSSYEATKGNVKASEAYRDVALEYEVLRDFRAEFRGQLDDVSPAREGVDASSVAVRKQVVPNAAPLRSVVILDVVGEKPVPQSIKDLPPVKQHTLEIGRRWSDIKDRLKFLKTKDGVKKSNDSLDMIEADIAKTEFGDIRGDIGRYRASKTPSQRAEELVLRGYADPVLYKTLGLKNSEIYVSVEAASKYTGKTLSPIARLEKRKAEVADARNIPYDSVRVEEIDFRTATERAKSGLSNPSDYSDLSLTQGQVSHFVELASGERPKIYFGVVAPKETPGDVSIAVDPAAPPTGRPSTWRSLVGRRVFGDKAYEAATGKPRPIISGGRIAGVESGRDIPMAIAEFVERPFAILNFPAWGRDILGKYLADFGAGKAELAAMFERVFIQISSKSTVLGKELLQKVESADAMPHVYAAQVERTAKLLQGKPGDLVTFQFDDLMRALKEAEIADAGRPYGGQLQNAGDMIATTAEANTMAHAWKTMEAEFVIETVGGVPVYLKDIAVKEMNFKGQWVPVKDMNKLVNDGVYTIDYVGSNIRGFHYKPTKPISEMTSKQRFALTLANEHIRVDDLRIFDATAQIVGGLDTLLPAWRAGGESPKRIFNLQKNVVSKLANWMGEHYDDRAVLTMMIDTMKKVGANSNDIDALAALNLIDERLGIIVPGAKKGVTQKASDLFKKHLDDPAVLDELLKDAPGSALLRRYFRTGLWRNELGWNEKIQHGLWDYNESVTKIAQNQGELLGNLKLMNYARDKGLLRSPAELENPAITPPEMKAQFVPFGDVSLISGRAKKYVEGGIPIASELKGMRVHKHLNDALMRQNIMYQLGRQTSVKFLSWLKLGYVFTTGGIIRNFLQNHFVMPALTKHPTYTGLFSNESLSMIRSARKGDPMAPEFEQFALLGGRRMSRSRAEYIANEEYIKEQAAFAQEAKEWVIPMTSENLNEFTRGAELLFKSLEGGPAREFMKSANFQRMRAPNFLGEQAPAIRPRGVEELATAVVREAPEAARQGLSRVKSAVKGAPGRVKNWMAEVYGMVDDLDKLAYYLELIRNHGYTPTQAMDAVQYVLIDFGDVSPAIESISMNPLAIVGGSTFIRWGYKSGMKWGPLLSGVNPPYAFAMMNSMQLYQKSLATTLGVGEEEIASKIRRNNEVYYPGVDVIRQKMASNDEDTRNLSFVVGSPSISMNTFSLGPSLGYNLDRASRMPSGVQQSLAMVAAFLPTDSAPIANLLFSTGEFLNGKMSYLHGDQWSDVGNGSLGDVVSIGKGLLHVAAKGVGPTYLRDYLRMEEGYMDAQTFLLKNIGLGSLGAGSVYEQSVLNSNDFNESMNAIRKKYNERMKDDPDNPKNVLLHEYIIGPYFGAEGEGLFRRGKRQSGWRGDDAVKYITDKKIRRQRTKQFVSSVPVILHAIHRGDFSWFNSSPEGMKWLSSMMERQGFYKIEKADGTLDFVKKPHDGTLDFVKKPH